MPLNLHPNVPRSCSCVVHTHRLGTPLDWGHDCEQQLIARARLWNELVDIERAARRQYLAALAAVSPELARAEGDLAAAIARREAAWEALRARRAAARSKADADTAAEDEAIAAARAEIGRLVERIKPLRKAARTLAAPLIATAEAQRKEAVKAARQTDASGLWWSNYNAVVAAYDTARSRAIKTGGELRHRHYDGTGSLTCQIQGGMTVEEFGAHTVARLAEALPGMRARGPGNGRMPLSLTLTVYTGRDADGKHVRRTVTFPLWLSRPLPDRARIQSVNARRARVGTEWRWTLSLLMRVEGDAPVRQGIACGVHLAWRQTAAGLRVATAVGEDGRVEHVALSERWQQRIAHIDTLTSRLDDAQNAIVAWLRETWAAGAPERIERQAKAIRQAPKIGHARIARLALDWYEHQDYRPDVYEALEAWRRQDKRTRAERDHLRDKVLAARREQYRVFAARLRERYAAIYVDDSDLARAAKLLVDDEETPLPAAARHQRQIAAPSELRALLRGAEPVATEGTTRTCSACGHAQAGPEPDDLMWRCAVAACGHLHDRDENAARNILAAGRASAQMASAGEGTACAAGSDGAATRYARMRAARERKRAVESGAAADRSQ